MSNQLVLTARPQGGRQIVAVPLREHQLKRLATRPSLYMGNTFGLHGTDLFLVQLPGLAEVLTGLKDAIKELMPDVAEGIVAAPTVHPGPMWVHPVIGPPPHILFMTAIVPDTEYPLHQGVALTAVIRPQGEAQGKYPRLDLMLLLADGDSHAEDLMRAAADLNGGDRVERHYAKDFVDEMEQAAGEAMERQQWMQRRGQAPPPAPPPPDHGQQHRGYRLPSYGPTKRWGTVH